MKEGQVSKPISGNNNLIIARVNSISKPQPIADYSSLTQDILRNTQPRIENGITNAIKKKMDIDDLRYNFF
jgi:hypothetical protein